MLLNRDTIAQHDRRILADGEQPQTLAQFMALINNQREPALIYGPIRLPRRRLFGGAGGVFVVESGVDLLVEENGLVKEILRSGRFELKRWDEKNVSLSAARTTIRDLDLEIASGVGASKAQRSQMRISLRYRVTKAHLLLKYERPLVQFCDDITHSLESMENGTNESEARATVQSLADKLQLVGAGSKIGLAIEELRLIAWNSGQPLRPTALELIKTQVQALEQQGFIVKLRQEAGNYYLAIPIINKADPSKKYVLYLACTSSYPKQAPQVFVARDGKETPLELTIIKQWRDTTTLADVLFEATDKL